MVQTLMESFCIDAAGVAHCSIWDKESLKVVAEFPDEDNWLLSGEKEFGLDGDGDAEEGRVDIEMSKVHAAERLESALRDDDDMSNAERDWTILSCRLLPINWAQQCLFSGYRANCFEPQGKSSQEHQTHQQECLDDG